MEGVELTLDGVAAALGELTAAEEALKASFEAVSRATAEATSGTIPRDEAVAALDAWEKARIRRDAAEEKVSRVMEAVLEIQCLKVSEQKQYREPTAADWHQYQFNHPNQNMTVEQFIKEWTANKPK
jgi:Mg/Co/Ni transporter MgtE